MVEIWIDFSIETKLISSWFLNIEHLISFSTLNAPYNFFAWRDGRYSVIDTYFEHGHQSASEVYAHLDFYGSLR